MNNTLILSTGGTFNKIYNPKTGNLDIDVKNSAVKSIQKHWLSDYKFDTVINKDSLDFTNLDREELFKYVKNCNYEKIVIIHGTDTMDLSAKYLSEKNIQKCIVFCGAMVPFSINPIEATANLAMALGFIKNAKNGIYISMNGTVDIFNKVIKNRKIGKFEKIGY